MARCWRAQGEAGLCRQQRRQRDGSGLGQRAAQAGEDGQVHMQPDPGQATDPQRQHAPLVFEHTEDPLGPDPRTLARRGGHLCAFVPLTVSAGSDKNGAFPGRPADLFPEVIGP